MPDPTPLTTLRELARQVSERSYAPYSGKPSGCVLLLSDGAWIPGVKVECASFPLSLPALNNALTTAVALGRSDLVAVAASHPFSPEEQAFLSNLEQGAYARSAPDAFVRSGTPLPAPTQPLDPYLSDAPPATPIEGVVLARKAAGRARVPESAFPVGAVLVTGTGRLIPGCNVEFSDWSRILCAERNALGTALSYGERSFSAMYLTCLEDAGCSPCGACRQLLVELAPGMALWMDRGDGPLAHIVPEALLPAYFSGAGLSRPIRADEEPRIA